MKRSNALVRAAFAVGLGLFFAAVATPTRAATTVGAEAKGDTTRERFIIGDYVVDPNGYNLPATSGTANTSVRVGGAIEFPLLNLPWMLEGDYRSVRYGQSNGGGSICDGGGTGGCVPGIGSNDVPIFAARNDDFDGRLAIKIANPRIYVGVGYLFRNANSPGEDGATRQHGFGLGAEKLPDLDRRFSLFGSLFYYPELAADPTFANGTSKDGVRYRFLKYNVGLTLDLAKSPLFLEAGYLGDRAATKPDANDLSHNGPYAGLGVHF